MNESYKKRWQNYIHTLRKRTIDIVFNELTEKKIETALELGAGDGYQSKLIKKFVGQLIATDFNNNILKNNPELNVEYLVCDAEKIGNRFDEKKFDLIFSSNMLEHIPNLNNCLNGIYKTLKDDGITVHSVPSVFLKVCNIVFYYPHIFRLFLYAIFTKGGFKELKQKYNNEAGVEYEDDYIENNPKTKQSKKNLFHFLLPQVHGISSSNYNEFIAFKKSTWIKHFNANGFIVIKILKGPVASGYGFHLNKLRTIFEKFGFTSENIFICKKVADKI